ncbi:MAG TPA: O-antigen ligase family protein, partial [Candidatus Limnocylindrales bacterium]|nr:O-antigen ligase family protein [Candidatus Limnocylindrales bacterium]
GRLVLSPAMSELTTGRSLLWAAAWEKSIARPWFGWGAGTFPVELGSFLPTGIKVYEAEDLVVLGISGGAHNAFLTTLAERGVLGGLAAAAMIGFLVYLSLRVFRARNRLARSDRALVWLAPFAVVLVLVRSLGESPGWFGGADGLVDFLAYGFAALLVGVAASLDRRGEPIREPEVAAPE